MTAFPNKPLLNDKFLDVTKLKASADDKLKVAKITIFLFDRAENTVGKGENAGYQYFLLFPVFFKAFFFRVLRSQNCVVYKQLNKLQLINSACQVLMNPRKRPNENIVEQQLGFGVLDKG